MYALALALVVLGYFLVIPVIKYFLDPKGLRKYPNFYLLSGISDIPFIYEAYKSFRSRNLFEAHKKHPVLRVGPNSLSYSDPNAIKDIYGHNISCIKDQAHTPHLADIVDKKEHARKRKVLSSAYTVKNLEEWEFKVADVSVKLIKAFDKRCTNLLRLNQNLNKEDLTTVAAIANIGLSEDLGFLGEGSDTVKSKSKDGILVWSYDWFKTLRRLSKVVSLSYRRIRATTRLKRHINSEKLDDFFIGEIVVEINIIINAGHDTIAIALRNALFFLLRNPKCLAKLREELDEVLEEDKVVALYSKVKHLLYLRAFIDESLRMLPPIVFGLPRRTPIEGTLILNEYVAGDTSVSISSFVMHHQESVFKDHNIYKPERWLGEEGKSLQPYFIPFSTGARGCISRNISYLEQTVLIASLVHRFEFALPHPDWNPPIRETTNLSPGPMPLKFGGE
ncbi:hypothetical protein N7467_006671 [Penicillium canescens]|nr:hypothetical protein N7467_006671 [Penicillium canescens]